MSENVNVEHLLDVFTSVDMNAFHAWDTCIHFLKHLCWHKPRETVLGSKIEDLPDKHRSKPSWLYELSKLFELLGKDTGRKRLLTHTLTLYIERGDGTQIARTLRELSDANRWLGLYMEGIKQLEEALEIWGRFCNATEQAWCLNYLARLLLDYNQLDSAQDAATRAIDLVPKEGNEYLVCQTHRFLGDIYHYQGEKEKAVHHLKTALDIASLFDWQNQLFWIHHVLAHLFLDECSFDDAHAHIAQAKSHVAESQYKLGRAMEAQARIWFQQRRLNDATSEALGAIEIFEKLGATEDERRCRFLLYEQMKSKSTRSRR